MKKLLLGIHFLTMYLNIVAQTGSISGIIVDAATGETLPGAMVVIDGSNIGTATDLDGNFKLSGIAPGRIDLNISYISYTLKKIQGIDVRENEITRLSVLLKPSESTELQEVVVAVKIRRENNVALTLQQKNAAVVSDGISAETIRRTPDRSTGEVLKRVSGASIRENKFAVIRGLSDRYNSAYLNGAPLPSTESDRRAFAFDIFPASVLDNLIVIKSATPDLPADFAGGIINLSTKAIPDEAFQSVSIGGSYHSLTTLKDFRTYGGGKYDWLGIDDGTRELNPALPGTHEFSNLSPDEKAAMAKLMTPSWKIDSKNAMPGMNFQYSTGRNFKIGKREAGFVFAYNYYNNPSRNQNVRREFEESETGVVQRAELRDEVYTESVLNSALLNTALKINKNNQLSLKNLYSINSSDRVTIREGVREMDNDPRQFERSSNRWFSENRIYSGQLQGDHRFGESGVRLNWIGGMSDVTNSIPNLRRMVYQKRTSEEGDTDVPYVAVVQNNGTIPTAAGNMFWSSTHERIYSLRYEAMVPVRIRKITAELKTGGMQQLRERTFGARNLGFSKYRKSTQPAAPFDSQLLTLPEYEIFEAAHLGLQGNGLGGFKLEEATKVHDSYAASAMLNAGFVMVDTRIFQRLRIITGARLESYHQTFSYTQLGTNRQMQTDTSVTDVLPSLNLVYELSRESNLRASVYRSVARPEFRELAPFQFYNFQLDNILSGDPLLKRTLITNADLRFEHFPGYGQLFCLSAFYKHFENPIELFMRTGTSGAPELSYTNVPMATAYGLELEYRLKLGLITANDSSGLLANTTVFTNAALVRSFIDLSDIIGSTERPLQGQSPCILNAGITYSHPKSRWDLSLSYNLAGRRIMVAGNVQEPDVWEKGRHLLDIQIAKSIGKYLNLRLNVKDLLAQTQLLYQNTDMDAAYRAGSDNLWQETTYGRSATISVSLNF